MPGAGIGGGAMSTFCLPWGPCRDPELLMSWNLCEPVLVAHALMRAAATLLSPFGSFARRPPGVEKSLDAARKSAGSPRQNGSLIFLKDPKFPQRPPESRGSSRDSEARAGRLSAGREAWGRLQPAEGFSPTSSEHEIRGRRSEARRRLKPAPQCTACKPSAVSFQHSAFGSAPSDVGGQPIPARSDAA